MGGSVELNESNEANLRERLTRVADNNNNTGGGIVGANYVDILVVRRRSCQLPLSHIEESHRTHGLGLYGVQLLCIISVDGMLQEQTVCVHRAIILQHAI